MPNSTKKKVAPIQGSSSSESELMIDEHKKSPRKSERTPQKRHRKRSKGGGGGGGSGEEQFEIEIEKTIKSCMKKDKVLTSDAVKRIIRKLILNEHVLAVVKLKEEELQKRAMDHGSEADDEDDEVVLKLTRSKAKQIDSGLLPLVPLKSNDDPDNETLKLLNAADTHDDSDTDQSYKPDDNEEPDFDQNTTVSDFDSLPTTPIVQRPEASLVQYSADGKFKIPRMRNESQTTSEAEEEPIFKRTRTKLCYKTTHIEDLESTLIAPDITTDLYEMNYDIDKHWADFLKEFTKPLNPNAEDEDDTDPEFTPIEEGVDAEEMKNVAISKKEYNLLLKELLTMVDENQLVDESETLIVGSPEKEIERRLLSPRSVRKRSTYRDEEETPGKNSELNTPTPQQDSLFQPDLMSTMVDECTQSPVIVPPIDDFYMTGTILIKTAEGAEPIKIDNVNLISGGNYENGMLMVPPFQEFLIRVPTEDLLRNSFSSTASSITNSSLNSTGLKSDTSEVRHESNVLQGPVTKGQLARQYDIIRLDKPPQILNHSTTETRFLNDQIQILQQQLRISVQYSIQGFLQTYAHPVHWKHADKYEKSLRELAANVSSPYSFFNVVNLSPALNLVDQWKLKRDYKPGKGDEVVNWFLSQQDKFTDKTRAYRVNLNPLIMSEMLQSPAFLYPQYLPTTGFKFVFSPQLRAPFSVGEEALIAFGLEKFGSQAPVMTKNGSKKPAVSLREICAKIAKQILKDTRTANGLYGQVFQWISASSPMNAIKYYKIHSKAPDFVHSVLPFETGRCLAERVSELPEIFRSYLASKGEQNKTAQRIAKSKPKASTVSETILTVAGGTKINVQVGFEVPKTSLLTSAAAQSIDEEDIPLQDRIKKTPHKRATKKVSSKQKVTICKQAKSKQTACTTLENLSQAFERKFEANLETISTKPHLFTIFEKLRALNIYAEMSNTPTGIRKLYPDVVDEGKTNKKPKIEEKPMSTPNDNNNKKKANDNLDRLTSWNYLEKVEEVLVGANKTEEYEKFIDTLKNFDSTKERVADLYFKIEKIFLPHHPELLSLFLTFLLPGQAAEVGKYFDYFMITNMDTFISKLHTYFAKQPSQIRKIINCLNELSAVEDVTLETVKESILPLLKGNPLLVDWFQMNFSSERPVDCHDADSEVIKSNLNDPITSTSEIYEELVLTDVPQSADMPSCGIKYGQGGISYAGRLGVLPAKLTFMPYDVVSSTSAAVKESSCSHAIKEYADAKLQEKVKPSVADVHSTTQDSEQQQPQCTSAVQDEDDQSSDDEQIKVVDENVLKAHAIRLNPVVHSTKGETYADIADLLVTPPENAEKYFSDDTKSPKKSTNVTRTNRKTNVLSPKPSTSKAGLKSPQPSTSSGVVNKRPGTSGVIAKAKRLKAMVESDSDVEVNPKDKKPKPMKVKKVQPVAEKEETPGETLTASESKEETTAPLSDVEESVTWTREEDKKILEEERNGYESFSELLERLQKELPHRNDAQIKERYEFLMEILRQIQQNT